MDLVKKKGVSLAKKKGVGLEGMKANTFWGFCVERSYSHCGNSLRLQLTRSKEVVYDRLSTASGFVRFCGAILLELRFLAITGTPLLTGLDVANPKCTFPYIGIL